MPYRRLPNTDQARLRALTAATDIALQKSIDDLAFSTATLTKARAFFPGFESAILQLKQAKRQQSGNSRKYNEVVKKARLYVSHFIQVLNFCILRGEIKPEVREFYGMDTQNQKLPSLILESDLLEWGKKIIDGEQQRSMHGGSPIYNPSIAVVKVKYDQFADAYHFQKTLQSNTARWSEKVAEMRQEADELILNIWNEVELHYGHFSDEEKRIKAQEYGVIYFFRPSEKNKMEAGKMQKNLSL